MESIRNSRLWKTAYYFGDRPNFRVDLFEDIRTLEREAAATSRRGFVGPIRPLVPAFRFDGSSDTGEGMRIAPLFPRVRFYDYTKSFKRMVDFLADRPKNYSLTFSHSGLNRSACLEVLRRRGNVAVVFSTPPGNDLPTTWEGFEVVNGDLFDARFLDPRGVVVGLSFKSASNRVNALRKAGSFVVEDPRYPLPTRTPVAA
jgi:hypothetical protein